MSIFFIIFTTLLPSIANLGLGFIRILFIFTIFQINFLILLLILSINCEMTILIAAVGIIIIN